MRICYLADAPSTHTQKWARFFSERGNDVHVVSFRPASIPNVHVHHVNVPLGKLGYLLGAVRARRLAERVAPDILHAHHATSYGLVGSIVGFHPYILSTWGSDVMWSPHQSRLLAWLVRFNLRRADVITATSHTLTVATRKFAPVGKCIHTIPFGVDEQQFRPLVESAQRQVLSIGTIKRLEPESGIDTLIAAFAQLTVTRPVRLRIGGDGSLRARLETMASALNVKDRVEFVGWIPHQHLPRFISQIDVFAVPSNREAFGVAALEALACQVPVVASDVDGLREVIRHGETGLLVPPADAAQLAHALASLVTNDLTRRQMGQAGRQFVLKHYRWEDNAKLMERLYDKILGTHSHG